MKFKISSKVPTGTDSVILFVKPKSEPKFETNVIQKTYLTNFKDDNNKLEDKEIKVLRCKHNTKYINLVLVAFDSKSENVFDEFRTVVYKIGAKLNELKSKKVFFDNPIKLTFIKNKEEIVRQIASALPLCDYVFDVYKSKKSEITDKEVVINAEKTLEAALSEGVNIAKGIIVARDLVNEPANVLTPAELAKRTVDYGKEFGFDVNVYDKKDIVKLGMKAFLEVAKASVNEPKLIVMKYNGGGKTIAKGIIGKGLTYDSGGLYLKPGDGMKSMKGDMAGAGAVIGAMCSIAANKLKKNVVAVVAACENLVDGNGYRNGDVISSMAGKSIFIASTDAEGRLTLADAITYMIKKEKVDSIMELSTLTGSCASFFGNVCSGVLTTDDSLYEKISSRTEISGEKYWRLPTYAEYKENIKSDIADLYNSSTAGAGGIAAGLFLDSFREDKPFMHLDIAGVTFTSKRKPGQIEGGTGYGVKTIYYYVKEEK